ncbi:hypothetical protein GBK02_15400 [Dechloromonas sp. TW-R-39-2]|uniref:hypothetical protein n=1 Tax=Dechloromonas sp. TW-R-39-2 TaxID=2654218 RepID=UPI00193E1D65|nr:hypothetical protein [Dechloromonas sp. TW-R-39-2]QRM20666.1 hypothetical protein GBK02_15400 [Dechloromonas sp. TW-R-39-2]
MNNQNSKTGLLAGKSYGWDTLAEAQRDFEIARQGSSYASKQRTIQMIEKINAERERNMGIK